MTKIRMLVLFILFTSFLASCGGSGGQSVTVLTVPTAPTDITVNAGDTAISIGWNAPADDGGSTISGYSVSISPSVSAGNIQISGTTAIISNLSNGLSYQLSVRASNTKGMGPASNVITVTPEAANTAGYTPITIDGEPGSPNGIYDPSLVRDSITDDLWLSYSSVNFYKNGSSDVVQDVGIRIARSSDNGNSFDYVATVAFPTVATVTDTDPNLSACGAATCTGHWVYETSWLVEDVGDSNPNRRFKLFAPKYFIYPGSVSSKTLYHLGAIVMWTASSPDSTWSAETVVLEWPLTPPEFASATDVTTLNSAMANCLLVAEGGVTVNQNALDFVFICPYVDTATTNVVQKIVLLRSTDHASSFQYVSTLLTPDDALPGVDFYSAPAFIVKEDVAPVLLATPVVDGAYAGSVVFPLVNLLVVDPIMFVPAQTIGHIGGASTYARGTGTLGILQSDAIVGATIIETQFRIVATHAMVESN